MWYILVSPLNRKSDNLVAKLKTELVPDLNSQEVILIFKVIVKKTKIPKHKFSNSSSNY